MSIFDQSEVAIYGAQGIGYTVYKVLQAINPRCIVRTFVVSERSDNPFSIEGIPVVLLDDFDMLDLTVLIALPEYIQGPIAEALKKKNILHYICISSEILEGLSQKYFAGDKGFLALSALERGDIRSEITVYISKFYKDIALRNNYEFPEWMVPIQAGAALTDKRIADVCDNTGDNISEKNGNYSELTAMYWISRYGMSEYLGLVHFRRILNISEDDLFRIKRNGVDVILPYPILLYPNIDIHHKRCIKDGDWDAMLQALEECAPEYAKALPELYKKQEFYHFNMLVAKREVFRTFCDWLFMVLGRVEELSVPKGYERSDRYLGYLGENLTTLYFLYHDKDFNIAHTGRYILH